MSTEITDDRGRVLRLPRPPRRIVSLVPSDTYTLLRLGARERLVGRTRYCVEPAPEVESIADVGGTKDPSIDAILELRPDLVVANQEENTRSDVEKLAKAGITVLLTFPKRLADGAAQVGRLARVLGDLDADARARVRFAYETLRLAEELRVRAERQGRVTTFVPIWADPLMTVNGDTFVSDVLDHAGAENVFADRDRRYPLAADLGRAEPAPRHMVEGRDVRYPRITDDELVARAPELVLLPDEPHPFDAADAERIASLPWPIDRTPRIERCVGRPLMWPGLMSLEGFEALCALVGSKANAPGTSLAPTSG
jgi:ABC-type Fe3+-hydroxamate transport system substrate-binding protein